MNQAILLISCKDQKGITASVTNFIAEHSGNILHADQHIDEQSNTFFMRVQWSLDGFDIERERIEEVLDKEEYRTGDLGGKANTISCGSAIADAI